MLSVLMSLYDKESPKNLFECLSSIAQQSLKADEVVLVYDGFINQNLKDIVSDFKDILNIKIIELESNVGLGDALKIGLINCSNELIARMDTDDICYKYRFEYQVKKMLENSDLDMVGASIIEFDQNDNKRLKKLPLTNEEIKLFAKWKNPLNHMTVMFKKQSVLKAGNYKKHLFMEDYNLWLRMISIGCHIINIEEPLVHARTNNMVDKRRGLKYLSSEIKLMKLKRELNFVGFINGILIFFVQSITRILPKFILSSLYNKDRKIIKEYIK